jgi:hypothetical protein
LHLVHRIYLVPGFFGFANFGDLQYFAHVRDRIHAAMERAGQEAEIHYVRTLPTASLRRRAARLADAIAETDDGTADLHLIGHSTGGIDARLLVSPGASLPTARELEPIAARVRTVVTIASPHHGAPLARMFTSVMGQSLLRALSMVTLHGIRLGSVPLPALVALAGALPGTGRLQGPVISILEQVYRQLLRDFDDERQREIEAFFGETHGDQALIPQLSPEGLDLLNASATARATTRYGCVITRSKPPSWRSMVSVGLSPTAQATYALFRALYRVAGPLPEMATPTLTSDQRAALVAAYRELPDRESNDAIVPTLSQLYGDVVHATWGDHLDVIGHFSDRSTDPPHVDWLHTHSGFDRARFDALWRDVGAYLLG